MSFADLLHRVSLFRTKGEYRRLSILIRGRSRSVALRRYNTGSAQCKLIFRNARCNVHKSLPSVDKLYANASEWSDVLRPDVSLAEYQKCAALSSGRQISRYQPQFKCHRAILRPMPAIGLINYSSASHSHHSRHTREYLSLESIENASLTDGLSFLVFCIYTGSRKCTKTCGNISSIYMKHLDISLALLRNYDYIGKVIS